MRIHGVVKDVYGTNDLMVPPTRTYFVLVEMPSAFAASVFRKGQAVIVDGESDRAEHRHVEALELDAMWMAGYQAAMEWASITKGD